MSEITVIGLGSMGSALARALVRHGHETTVWNRTAARTMPLVAEGAKAAASVEAAVEASPLLLVCIDDYRSTRDLLGPPDVSALLAGRTLIQLTTGSPQEAREAEEWAQRRRAGYLDGAIMAYPAEIGRPDAMILASGAEPAFRRSEPYLRCLGGDLRYLGERAGAAATLDLALLTYNFGTILGLVHGALMCEAEGIGIDRLGTMFTASRAALMGERARQRADVIHHARFSDPGASLSVWNGALQRIREQARAAGINAEFPDFAAAIFERAIAAGLAGEDVTALIKVLRQKRNT
jgi:3-hydroxyisobutyrate dehydrogenase-like beta-hydroxyacid dehydrogenase